jgi:hypothetical protein
MMRNKGLVIWHNCNASGIEPKSVHKISNNNRKIINK